MKKQITFKEWELAVRKAKAFVNNYDKVRWTICDIALGVCETTKGGRKGSEVFTLKRFADEIELNAKTLYEWIRIKKLVYDKLPITIKAKIKTYKYTDIAEVSKMVDENTSSKNVHNALKTVLNLPPENRKFKYYYERDLGAILYNAQRPINMINVDKEIIEKMINRCNLISSLLTKELEIRAKYSNNERINENLKTRKEALENINQLGI